MTLDDLVTSLKAYNPQKIILFGSHAVDADSSTSDYDIALIKNTDKPFHERVIEARRLLRTPIPVDLFVFTPQELEEKKNTNYLISEILSTGKVIYG